MFNFYKVLFVFAALLCIAAAYPSILGPTTILSPLGPKVIVGPAVHPYFWHPYVHGPLLAHPGHVIVG